MKEGEYGMTDKQYEGMLKDNIASFDRIAMKTNDHDALKDIKIKLFYLKSVIKYIKNVYSEKFLC